MATGIVASYLSGTAAVFSLPAGIAPLAGAAATGPGTRFGLVLLGLTVVAMAALGAAARGMTSKAFAATPGELQKELVGAEVRTRTGFGWLEGQVLCCVYLSCLGLCGGVQGVCSLVGTCNRACSGTAVRQAANQMVSVLGWMAVSTMCAMPQVGWI
jgi:hypothetical protein